MKIKIFVHVYFFWHKLLLLFYTNGDKESCKVNVVMLAQ